MTPYVLWKVYPNREQMKSIVSRESCYVENGGKQVQETVSDVLQEAIGREATTSSPEEHFLSKLL